MTGIVLCGSWRVTVTRKDSDWAQRVVVTGGADAVIPGVVGAAATISGDRWDLTVEHDPEAAGVRARTSRRTPYANTRATPPAP